MRRALFRVVCSAGLAGAAALTVGCAGGGERDARAAPGGDARVARAPVLARPASSLHTRVYVLESENTAIERSLETLRRDGSAWDAPEFDRWRDNGVRVLSIDAASIDALDALWSSRGLSQRVQLGEPTRWAAAHAGPAFDALRVGTDTGLLDLNAGRLEVMARSWSVSRRSWDDDRPGVRLELVPRYRPTHERMFSQALLDERHADRDHLWFDRLRAEVVTGGDRALVFIAASPLADWSTLDPSPVLPRATRLFVAPALPVPGEDASDSEPNDSDESVLEEGTSTEPFGLPQSQSAETQLDPPGQPSPRRLTLGSLLLPHGPEVSAEPLEQPDPQASDGPGGLPIAPPPGPVRARGGLDASSEAPGRVLTVLVLRPMLDERSGGRDGSVSRSGPGDGV